MSKTIQTEVAKHIDTAAGKRKRVARRNAFEETERKRERYRQGGER